MCSALFPFSVYSLCTLSYCLIYVFIPHSYCSLCSAFVGQRVGSQYRQTLIRTTGLRDEMLLWLPNSYLPATWVEACFSRLIGLMYLNCNRNIDAVRASLHYMETSENNPQLFVVPPAIAYNPDPAAYLPNPLPAPELGHQPVIVVVDNAANHGIHDLPAPQQDNVLMPAAQEIAPGQPQPPPHDAFIVHLDNSDTDDDGDDIPPPVELYLADGNAVRALNQLGFAEGRDFVFENDQGIHPLFGLIFKLVSGLQLGAGVGYTPKQARISAIASACRRTEIRQISDYANSQYQLMYSLHHPVEIVDRHYDYLAPIMQRYQLHPSAVEARVEDRPLSPHRFHLRPNAYVDYPRVLGIYVEGNIVLALYIARSVREARKGVKRRLGVALANGLVLEHVVGQDLLLVNDSEIKAFLVARGMYFGPIVAPPALQGSGSSTAAKRARDD